MRALGLTELDAVVPVPSEPERGFQCIPDMSISFEVPPAARSAWRVFSDARKLFTHTTARAYRYGASRAWMS